jgi:hypothetical protein
MTLDNDPTVRLPRFSARQLSVLAEISELRRRDGELMPATITEFNRVREVRALAADGHLAAVVADAPPAWRNALAGAAFALAWPVVYNRLTRRVELNRGHTACAASVSRMAPECLDRFYDDVEGVVLDLLEHARTPVRNIEAWLTSRLNAATVDAYRRRRGELGALQRPRLPRWVSDGLADDPWLTDLAVLILSWVGVRSTAGCDVWPLESWALRRTQIRGDVGGTDAGQVARDVHTVLGVMKQRPTWYADYVERPLGRKQPPVVGTDDMDALSPLRLGSAADTDDDYLSGLAAQALQSIRLRVRNAEDPRTAVPEVLRSVFGGATGSHGIDRPPWATPDYEERIVSVLDDPGSADRVVAIVRKELDSFTWLE